MAKFTLPTPSKPKKGANTVAALSPDEWQRRITLPVNKAIIDEVETDDEVTVILTGKVTRQVSESGEYPEKSITLNVKTVEVTPDKNGKASKDFKSGFKKATAKSNA